MSKQWEHLYNETKYAENGPQKAVDIKEWIRWGYLTCSLLHRLMRVCVQFLKNIDKEGEEVIQSLHLSSLIYRTNLGEFQLVTSNMIRLLNLMRVYQFREELIRGLRIQIKEKREKIEEVQSQLNEAKEILQRSVDTLQLVEDKRKENQEANQSLEELIEKLHDILQKEVSTVCLTNTLQHLANIDCIKNVFDKLQLLRIKAIHDIYISTHIHHSLLRR